MAQPPGCETRASPQRAIIGPKTSTLARIFRTTAWRCRVRNIRGVEMRDPAFIRTVAAVYFDGDAVMLQQTRQSRDIRQTRQVFQRQRLVSQQEAPSNALPHSFTRNRYSPHQTLTASNTDARHAAALRRTCRPVGRTVVSGCHGIPSDAASAFHHPSLLKQCGDLKAKQTPRLYRFPDDQSPTRSAGITHSDIRVDHSSPSVRFGIRTIQINGRTMTLQRYKAQTHSGSRSYRPDCSPLGNPLPVVVSVSHTFKYRENSGSR